MRAERSAEAVEKCRALDQIEDRISMELREGTKLSIKRWSEKAPKQSVQFWFGQGLSGGPEVMSGVSTIR